MIGASSDLFLETLNAKTSAVMDKNQEKQLRIAHACCRPNNPPNEFTSVCR